MNRIMSLAAHWWGGRTLRERRMVAVMNLLLLAVVVSLGVVRPVLDWRAAAADRAAVAADVLVEVRAAVAAIRPAGSTAPAPAEGLEPLVRRTAEAAGLEVVTLMSPSGQLGFQLSRVGSGPLFAWLAVLETDHRLTICSLGVTENADATLNVEGSVSVGGCVG
ncbi:MAG: type II secretion system protein M [Alphaproteobacteria bacterium]|uniref:type II secretion system protein GspM n=1 Tax=Brevundimonas sp. TaxID=1871086 RepID=UPI0017AC29E1|nr:type II secretion system protein GspM [Brevundimonas sp.]MBA3050744.1 type II secretion system protein M [Brevundimonas sp.]MBU3973953.1 type II secretion system protein M [Alphaproteobacteria bacterium]MBU4038614.1 type II secretion system protein M [Alphaproteobacteria bacterium]MBU4136688.1 type II secretion system protein M [Alphaproteobacteria bacterium]